MRMAGGRTVWPGHQHTAKVWMASGWIFCQFYGPSRSGGQLRGSAEDCNAEAGHHELGHLQMV